MASEKKVVLIFTDCESKALLDASSPALAKLKSKGVVLSNVSQEGDYKALAAKGAKEGENLWEAATKNGFNVADCQQAYDMCVINAPSQIDQIEAILAPIMEAGSRATLYTLVGKGIIIFNGPGMAKGKVIDKLICPCVVAPTLAYVADFPVPEECEAPICYAALKEVNYKLKEIQKLQSSIVSMEAAMERKNRNPWDKHDCA